MGCLLVGLLWRLVGAGRGIGLPCCDERVCVDLLIGGLNLSVVCTWLGWMWIADMMSSFGEAWS